jgi:hypothetical protein
MSSKKAKDLLNEGCPDAIIEIFDENLSHFRESKKRISEEGQVVRDLRGCVVEHPSLSVQKTVSEILLKIIDKHGRRTSDFDLSAL